MTTQAQLMEIMAAAAKDPKGTLLELDKLDAEEKLLDFIKQGWGQIEPGVDFVSGWAVEAICDHLEAVSHGHIKKLLINVPPGCTKSMTTNVFFPAWEWGPRKRPNLRYISCSYAQELSIRDNVRGRDVIYSDWYQQNWGNEFSFKSDVNAKILYENNVAGWRKAASSGAALTGFRGDRIIVDDPHAVQESESEQKRETTLMWFTETLPTRLNDLDESVIIVIMQRVHERDVSGLILAKELGYEHLMLPMEYEPERRCKTYIMLDGKKKLFFKDPRKKDGQLLWPERFSAKGVEDLKQTFRAMGGTYAEAGQLQQRPAPRGGGMFQKKDFTIIENIKEVGKIRKIVRGWDLAGSKRKQSPYTASVKIGITIDNDIVIMNADRGRWTPGQVNKEVKDAAVNDGYTVDQDLPQDPGQAGKAQISAFAKLLAGYPFVHSTESGSKEDRARPLAAQCEAGNVYMLRGEWNDAFVGEAAVFPAGEFKDQIDAASRAYARLIRKKIQPIAAGPVIVKRR